MAKGDPPTSPWVYDTEDYLERHLTITMPFDEATGNIQNGTVIHRDPGCLFSTIIFADPTKQLLRKDLPAAPVGDTTLTAQQIRNATGFRTISDLLASGQITAQ